MLIEILTTVLAGQIAITSFIIAARLRYVHQLRTADVNAHSHILLSESSIGKVSDTHKEIAKTWLRIAERYRCTSIYLSLSAANFMVALIFYALSLFFVLLETDPIILVLFPIGAIFTSLGIMDHLDRYWNIQPKSAIERFSWRLAELFPPLVPPLNPTHLGRWGFLKDPEKIDWAKSYLEKLQSYQNIKRWEKMFGELIHRHF